MYQPKQFQASPDAEMRGAVYQGMADNLMAEASQNILHKYGIDNVEPEQWYPHQLSLDVAKAIHDSPNGMQILVAMGRGVGKTAVFPNEIKSIDDLFEVIPHLYQANVRNQHPEERFYLDKIDERTYRFKNNTPSSNQLIYGMLWELVQRFLPQSNGFVLKPISGMEQDSTEGAIIDICLDQ